MRAATALVVLTFGLLALPAPKPNPAVAQAVSYISFAVVETRLERGLASWYGYPFHGRLMANGEPYDKNAWVMATRHLPLGTFARVRYGDRECVVRVTDRGPYIVGRGYDVSEAVARYLGFYEVGLAEVEVEVLRAGDSSGRR